jgi:hypothetical protein
MTSRAIAEKPPEGGWTRLVLRRVLFALATIAFAAVGWASAKPASAQSPYPCSNSPYERQVGQTTSGGVVVPLCVALPQPDPDDRSASGGNASAGPDRSALGGIYIEGPRYGPPRGWRPTYGGFMSFVVSQDENGDNEVYDMVLTLGHATPEEAAAAATALCVEKALFPEPHSSCHPQILDHAYYLIVQRDTEDGQFQALQFDDPRGFGSDIVRRSADRREVCSRADAPDYPRPCFRLVAYDRNGIWPR